MTDREFDEIIREKLSAPQEDIPSGLWERIEVGLDASKAPGRRAAVLHRWMWGVSGAAAAVAVLAFVGVRLLNPQTETVSIAESGVEIFDIVETPSSDENAISLLAMAEEDTASKEEHPAAKDADNFTSGCAIHQQQSNSQTDNPVSNETDSAASEPGDMSSSDNPASDAQPVLVDTDEAGEPECEIRVDNSDIEAVYGTEESGAKRKRTPLELTIGGNSFGGPQKNRVPKIMYSQGHRTPTYTFVEDGNSDKFDLPLSFGVGVKYSITRWLGVGVGVNYTLLGKKTSGTYYTEDGWSYNVDMKNAQHYIGIPVDIFFSVFRNRWWDTYATVGGCVEKCISNKYTGFHEGTQLTYSPKVNGVQTSVKVGLGVEFSPLSFMGIYIDPSLRYYFDNSQPRSIRTAQPLAFGVEAGLRFRL